MGKILFCNLSASIVIAFLLSSCSKDFLDQKPASTVTEESYYKTVPELETGLVACYAAVRYQIDYYWWMITDLGSDDADCGSLLTDQPDLYDISYSRQKVTNWPVVGLWASCYQVIARCNTVIEKSTDTQGDFSDIAKIVNQAKYLRAFSYYYLVSLYGDVPLTTTFLSPNDINLKRSPASEVWILIEADLKDATNLPVKSQMETGRVTSGAAWSLLGKVYLTEGKVDLAAKAFSKVVNSGQYSLVNDFGFIFRHEGENCAESIFEIQHKNGIESGGNLGTWNPVWRMPRDDGGWGFDCPTKDLLNEFEEGDPRIIYTFLFQGDIFPNGTDTYTAADADSPTGYNSRKAWIPYSERENIDWTDWDYNTRYMRYAEVLLLYAESLNELNKPDSAVTLVNLVRERARNTPTTDPQRIFCNYPLPHPANLLPPISVTNKDDLRKAIWHEQRVELANEGERRNMLLRTNQFGERMEKSKAYANVTIQPYMYLLPIPESEIELSDNVLTQNPGY